MGLSGRLKQTKHPTASATTLMLFSPRPATVTMVPTSTLGTRILQPQELGLGQLVHRVSASNSLFHR